MDAATIHALALEIATALPVPWNFVVVQAIITLAAAAGGAYFGEYLRTKAHNLATKEDFKPLAEQLRANTRPVETVKSEIGQQDWAEREWSTVRRLNLERLISTIHACEDHFNRLKDCANAGEYLPDRDPIMDFEAKVALYFPELDRSAQAFSTVHRNICLEMNRRNGEMMRAQGPEAKHAVAIEIGRLVANSYPAVVAARAELITQARSLMRQIAAVSGR